MFDAVRFYLDILSQGIGVYRGASKGATMPTNPDPFDKLAEAVFEAADLYLNVSDIPFIKRTHAARRANLIAACDVLVSTELPNRAEHGDPVPDGLAERVTDSLVGETVIAEYAGKPIPHNGTVFRWWEIRP